MLLVMEMDCLGDKCWLLKDLPALLWMSALVPGF